MTPPSQDLRSLANWCLLRSVQDHDAATTLALLTRKVAAIRARKYSHDPSPATQSVLPRLPLTGMRG